MRHGLHRRRASADDGDALVRQLVERRAVRIAARIGIVPAACMERMSLERIDARDAGELGDMQRSGAKADELRREGIAAIGFDQPTMLVGEPTDVRHLGVEQRIVVEAGTACRCAGTARGFPARARTSRSAVAGLFEQRHVDHRRGVALRAGIAVPVPGAAEVAALLDDAHIRDAGLDQPRAGYKAGEAAADEGEGDMVGLRRTLLERRVGVFGVVGEARLRASDTGRCRPDAAACPARRGIWRAGPACRWGVSGQRNSSGNRL